MTRNRLFIYVILLPIALLLTGMSHMASRYPTGDFNSPVQRDFKLSGTFGELRGNHFHAGLDVKSQHGVSGDPIYAAHDGFISRIKIEAYGYGNALYIQHPNGFTTLYAHLDRFAEDIEAWVKAEQYRQKNFAVDLKPPANLFRVKKGQFIANMGNTGYSFGPHLHFEIRHTQGQIPINPLHFGFKVTDQSPPVLQRLLLNEHDSGGMLIRSTVIEPIQVSSGVYKLPARIEVSAPVVTFSIQSYDIHEDTPNRNGIYGIECKVDGSPTFAFTLDEVPFEKTRYLNAHIEYAQKVLENRYFHRCHPLEGNKLGIYTTDADKARLALNYVKPRQVEVKAFDFPGNASVLTFEVIRISPKPDEAPALAPYGNTMATPDKISILSAPGVQAVFPKGSFYEKTNLNIEVIPSTYADAYSPFVEISPVESPVHYYFDLLVDGSSVPERLRDKACIIRHGADGRFVNCGGKWIGQNLSASVRQIGTYSISVDTIPPKVELLHFGPKMTGWERMAFKITDNYPAADKARDLQFNAWVDGEWILLEYDGKNDMLIHNFDGRIPPGQHELIIKVTDDRDNMTIFEKKFTL